MTHLPKPRGALSVAVLAALVDVPAREVPRIDIAPESPDDAALTLWVLHELSYGGFHEVDDRAEDEPELVRVRRRLEQDLEADAARALARAPDGRRPRHRLLRLGRRPRRALARPARADRTRPRSRCWTCSGSARSTTSRRPTPRPG